MFYFINKLNPVNVGGNQMKNGYFGTYYQQGDNPVFCCRSAETVYEEQLCGGAFLACGWNASGYPLNVLSGFPNRLDKRNFTEPFAFNVEADGVSLDFGLVFAGFETVRTEENETAIITLESKIKPVRIKVITVLDGTAMFSRRLEIENLSDKYINISRLSIMAGGLESLDKGRLGYDNRADEIYSVGYFDSDRWGKEGMFGWHKLMNGVTSVDTRFGRDRFRHPLIFIRNNLLGKIWFMQLGWSGGCRFTLDYNAQPDCDSHLAFKAEITSHNPMYALAPHETFLTPELHIGLVSGGLDDAVNQMHSHMRKTVLTMPEAAPSQALVGAGMGAEHDMGVESTKVFIERFAELGAEVFIVDAGWVCPPDKQIYWGDYNGLNVPDADRYPNGIGEIADYCHANGMKFGLWVEIEGLGDLSNVKKEHPEWLANNAFGEKARRFLDFTVPEAAQWAEDELARIITEYKLDLLRVDYNTDSGEYFNMRDTGCGYPECLNLRHFNAVYRMYENLKKRFPEVIFENCAGGGGRTDAGIMKFFNHTWVSDCQCAPESVYITNGMTMALPPERVDRLFAGMGCHIYGSLGIQMRNTMLTHMTLNVISPYDAEMNSEQAEFVKHSVKIYKEFIRPFIAESKIYHHTPETEKMKKNGFCVLEIASPDKSRGAAAVFTLVNSGETTVRFKAKGADKSKKYTVYLDNEGESFTVSGRELCTKGIEIDVSSSLSSELILYKEN